MKTQSSTKEFPCASKANDDQGYTADGEAIGRSKRRTLSIQMNKRLPSVIIMNSLLLGKLVTVVRDFLASGWTNVKVLDDSSDFRAISTCPLASFQIMDELGEISE